MEQASNKRVLDPCCGSRMMWFDRAHPDVVFGDKRSETITVTDRSHGNASGQRVLRVEPDVPLDFRALPYADGTFNLVAFDPPHLVRAGPKSWLAAKYGKLGEDWRDDLRRGFAECFRVDLLHKLHDELRYHSLAALTEGIARDCDDARAWLSASGGRI